MHCLNVDPALPLTSCWTLDKNHMGQLTFLCCFLVFLRLKWRSHLPHGVVLGLHVLRVNCFSLCLRRSLFRCYFLNYGGSMFGAGKGKGIPQCQCKCTWVSEKTVSKEQGVCMSGTEATCGRTGAGEIRVLSLWRVSFLDWGLWEALKGFSKGFKRSHFVFSSIMQGLNEVEIWVKLSL